MKTEVKKDGFNELKELVDFMKAEGVLKLQTANCSIEVHPSYLGRTDSVETQPEPREIPPELTPEEKMTRAKRIMGEMLGGI
jgi:hypothetical protein